MRHRKIFLSEGSWLRRPPSWPEALLIRASFVALALATLVVIAGTAFFTQADEPLAPAAVADAPATIEDAKVVSFDGTLVPVTIYKPAGASAENPVPVVLHSHGWGGSRVRDGAGLPGLLWQNGFGVITIDARGHGESDAVAEVHHKDFEVKDTIAVLDYAYDALDWVQKEPESGIAKDIIAGGAGYSYGGGMQLTAASWDKRLDAIAPEITWTDLPSALAPEGVPKSVWLDILIGFAVQGGVSYDPRIDDWYRTILLTGEIPQDALDHFAGSSARLDEIDADVLFIQGVPDVLFNLNQAVHGYEALEARGAGDIRLFTHLTGHVLPYAQPFALDDARRQTFQEEGPCGVNAQVVLAWLDETLRDGPASGIPEVSFALEDGECIALDALPDDTVRASLPLVAAPAAGGSVLVPLLSGEAVVAGIPHLRANVTTALPQVSFVGLVAIGPDGVARVVDDQTTPVRLEPGATLDVEMAGVATRLASDEQLFLRIDGLNEWYAHNAQRAPGGALLQDVVVTLPVVG